MKEWMYDWGGLNVVLFHAINAHHAAWLDWIMLALTWAGDHDRFSAYLTVLALATFWRYSRDPASPHTRAWVLALATLSLGYLLDGLLRDRLLVIFDVFDEWFRQPTFEGCLFVNVLLEITDRRSPIHQASRQQLARIRVLLEEFAREAGISEPESFARQWHILMKGSIVAAGEGDVDAARRAQVVGRLLLADSLQRDSSGEDLRSDAPPGDENAADGSLADRDATVTGRDLSRHDDSPAADS